MDHASPYLGLTAFDERNSSVFFGREELVESLLLALKEHYFIAVVGPSGVGKTSILRAGLMPALRSQVPTPRLAYLHPAQHPLQSLALALTENEVASEVRTAILRVAQSRDLASLQRIWEAKAPDILIVDQFEDLYTLVGRSEAEEFISLIVSNAEAARTRSVISFRSDFISQAIANPALARMLSTATF